MINIEQMALILDALPDPAFTGREQAIQFAKCLHERFRKELNRFKDEDTVVTASIGVTTMVPEDLSYEDTLQRADRALYEAKSKGKDRIVSL